MNSVNKIEDSHSEAGSQRKASTISELRRILGNRKHS